MEGRRIELGHLYDEFTEVLYHFSRQDNIDEEARRQFTSTLETYLEATDSEVIKYRRVIEAKDDELTSDYQRKNRKMEDQFGNGRRKAEKIS